MMSLVLISVSLWLAVFLVGCGGRLEHPERFGDAGACDAPAILAARCTSGCHSGGSPSGNLDLASEGLSTRLYDHVATDCGNGKLIDSMAPSSSVLLEKLTSSPPCGRQMPIGDSLSDSDLQCLSAWVDRIAASGP
jgi:hypothetical protein